MSEQEPPQVAGAYVDRNRVIICYSKCWSCICDSHYDPPQWHTWADDEDIEAALAAGQPDPSSSRCSCPCAGADEGPLSKLLDDLHERGATDIAVTKTPGGWSVTWSE